MRAKDLYISTLFKKSLLFLQGRCDKIFILSAKYGLLELEDIIEMYDVTLNKMKKSEITEWSNKVIEKLQTKTNIKKDRFIILAGDKYRNNIIKYLNYYEIPMRNLSIGKQLKFLKAGINNE